MNNDRRGSHEFPPYCRLAGRLVTPHLHAALTLRRKPGPGHCVLRNVDQALSARRAKS